MNYNNLVIVDGSHMLYRVRYSLADLGCNFKVFTFGFMKALICELERVRKLTKDESSLQVIVAFDKGIAKERREIYPEYKGNREYVEDEGRIAYNETRSYLSTVLPQIGIGFWILDGIEADDLAACISREPNSSGFLISGDRDWMLSVNPNWELLRPMDNTSYSYKSLQERYQYDDVQSLLLLVKAMVGDGSDNIPGIYGIGEGYGVQFAKQLLTEGKITSRGKKATDVINNMSIIERNKSLIGPTVALAHRDEIIASLEESVKSINKFSQVKWVMMCSKIESTTLVDWAQRLRDAL